MSLSKDQKKWIAAAVTPVVTAVATEMAVAAAKSLLEKLIVTNYEKRTLSSTKQMSPTTDTTSLDSRNTSGVQNDAPLTPAPRQLRPEHRPARSGRRRSIQSLAR